MTALAHLFLFGLVTGTVVAITWLLAVCADLRRGSQRRIGGAR